MRSGQITYRRDIKYFADKQEMWEFSNSGPEHARIVLSNVFRTAEKYVYIFAGNLNGDISQGEYLYWLGKCLKREYPFWSYSNLFKKESGKGIIVKVILAENPQLGSKAAPLIKKYRDLFPDRVSFGIATKESLKSLEGKFSHFSDKGFGKDLPFSHFTISDDRMYRLEFDTKDYFAACNFNDPVTALKLKEIFYSIEAVSIQ